MALFVIPVALKGAASFIAANGARQATKKYGPKVVKKAQEAMKKRETSIQAKIEGKTTGKYATRDKSMNQLKKENEAMMKAEKTFQSKLKNEKNIKEGADAFKQLDGKLNFKTGGKVKRSTYNKGGYAKVGQPMYGHGECPKAKAN